MYLLILPMDINDKSTFFRQQMEWMYKGNKTDKEEYLLGKRVDKHFEEEEEPPEENTSKS